MKKSIYLTAIIALFLVSSCKFLKFKKEPVMIHTVDSIYDEYPEVDTFVQEVEPMPEAPKDIYLLSEIDDKYLIVVGSFQTLKYAKSHANKFKTLGFDTKVISKPDGFYMVSARAFESQSAAYQELRNFRKSVVKSSWVFVNKRAINQGV